MGGYGTNTGEMVATASTIKGLAQTVRDLKNKVSSTAVTAQNFGRAHIGPGGQYPPALQKIATMIEQHAAAMDDFAGRLEGSRGGYEFAESSNTATVRKAGGN
ncbi:hypothetical protein GCM10012275_22960 [Longimycelium tulufanense]|uniref:Uncharacterized protein n=1 Tax=Longimycelium tulufanense TaxID=907463 RepID=A0A8J3CC21_9PSEU|nr:hypothetical protein [Longimycelium tulufanense]GGM51467.1 hypothetical protein GCM10012275_22960 [Longimycelium tulufanense]